MIAYKYFVFSLVKKTVPFQNKHVPRFVSQPKHRPHEALKKRMVIDVAHLPHFFVYRKTECFHFYLWLKCYSVYYLYGVCSPEVTQHNEGNDKRSEFCHLPDII